MSAPAPPRPEESVMSLRLSHTTWDALDPFAVAEFWRGLLG